MANTFIHVTRYPHSELVRDIGTVPSRPNIQNILHADKKRISDELAQLALLENKIVNEGLKRLLKNKRSQLEKLMKLREEQLDALLNSKAAKAADKATKISLLLSELKTTNDAISETWQRLVTNADAMMFSIPLVKGQAVRIWNQIAENPENLINHGVWSLEQLFKVIQVAEVNLEEERNRRLVFRILNQYAIFLQQKDNDLNTILPSGNILDVIISHGLMANGDVEQITVGARQAEEKDPTDQEDRRTDAQILEARAFRFAITSLAKLIKDDESLLRFLKECPNIASSLQAETLLNIAKDVGKYPKSSRYIMSHPQLLQMIKAKDADAEFHVYEKYPASFWHANLAARNPKPVVVTEGNNRVTETIRIELDAHSANRDRINQEMAILGQLESNLNTLLNNLEKQAALEAESRSLAEQKADKEEALKVLRDAKSLETKDLPATPQETGLVESIEKLAADIQKKSVEFADWVEHANRVREQFKQCYTPAVDLGQDRWEDKELLALLGKPWTRETESSEKEYTEARLAKVQEEKAKKQRERDKLLSDIQQIRARAVNAPLHHLQTRLQRPDAKISGVERQKNQTNSLKLFVNPELGKISKAQCWINIQDLIAVAPDHVADINDEILKDIFAIVNATNSEEERKQRLILVLNYLFKHRSKDLGNFNAFTDLTEENVKHIAKFEVPDENNPGYFTRSPVFARQVLNGNEKKLQKTVESVWEPSAFLTNQRAWLTGKQLISLIPVLEGRWNNNIRAEKMKLYTEKTTKTAAGERPLDKIRKSFKELIDTANTQESKRLILNVLQNDQLRGRLKVDADDRAGLDTITPADLGKLIERTNLDAAICKIIANDNRLFKLLPPSSYAGKTGLGAAYLKTKQQFEQGVSEASGWRRKTRIANYLRTLVNTQNRDQNLWTFICHNAECREALNELKPKRKSGFLNLFSRKQEEITADETALNNCSPILLNTIKGSGPVAIIVPNFCAPNHNYASFLEQQPELLMAEIFAGISEMPSFAFNNLTQLARQYPVLKERVQPKLTEQLNSYLKSDVPKTDAEIKSLLKILIGGVQPANGENDTVNQMFIDAIASHKVLSSQLNASEVKNLAATSFVSSILASRVQREEVVDSVELSVAAPPSNLPPVSSPEKLRKEDKSPGSTDLSIKVELIASPSRTGNVERDYREVGSGSPSPKTQDIDVFEVFSNNLSQGNIKKAVEIEQIALKKASLSQLEALLSDKENLTKIPDLLTKINDELNQRMIANSSAVFKELARSKYEKLLTTLADLFSNNIQLAVEYFKALDVNDLQRLNILTANFAPQIITNWTGIDIADQAAVFDKLQAIADIDSLLVLAGKDKTRYSQCVVQIRNIVLQANPAGQLSLAARAESENIILDVYTKDANFAMQFLGAIDLNQVPQNLASELINIAIANWKSVNPGIRAKVFASASVDQLVNLASVQGVLASDANLSDQIKTALRTRLRASSQELIKFAKITSAALPADFISSVITGDTQLITSLSGVFAAELNNVPQVLMTTIVTTALDADRSAKTYESTVAAFLVTAAGLDVVRSRAIDIINRISVGTLGVLPTVVPVLLQSIVAQWPSDETQIAVVKPRFMALANIDALFALLAAHPELKEEIKAKLKAVLLVDPATNVPSFIGRVSDNNPNNTLISEIISTDVKLIDAAAKQPKLPAVVSDAIISALGDQNLSSNVSGITWLSLLQQEQLKDRVLDLLLQSNENILKVIRAAEFNIFVERNKDRAIGLIKKAGLAFNDSDIKKTINIKVLQDTYKQILNSNEGKALLIRFINSKESEQSDIKTLQYSIGIVLDDETNHSQLTADGIFKLLSSGFYDDQQFVRFPHLLLKALNASTCNSPFIKSKAKVFLSLFNEDNVATTKLFPKEAIEKLLSADVPALEDLIINIPELAITLYKGNYVFSESLNIKMLLQISKGDTAYLSDENLKEHLKYEFEQRWGDDVENQKENILGFMENAPELCGSLTARKLNLLYAYNSSKVIDACTSGRGSKTRLYQTFLQMLETLDISNAPVEAIKKLIEIIKDERTLSRLFAADKLIALLRRKEAALTSLLFDNKQRLKLAEGLKANQATVKELFGSDANFADRVKEDDELLIATGITFAELNNQENATSYFARLLKENRAVVIAHIFKSESERKEQLATLLRRKDAALTTAVLRVDLVLNLASVFQDVTLRGEFLSEPVISQAIFNAADTSLLYLVALSNDRDQRGEQVRQLIARMNSADDATHIVKNANVINLAFALADVEHRLAILAHEHLRNAILADPISRKAVAFTDNAEEVTKQLAIFSTPALMAVLIQHADDLNLSLAIKHQKLQLLSNLDFVSAAVNAQKYGLIAFGDDTNANNQLITALQLETSTDEAYLKKIIANHAQVNLKAVLSQFELRKRLLNNPILLKLLLANPELVKAIAFTNSESEQKEQAEILFSKHRKHEDIVKTAFSKKADLGLDKVLQSKTIVAALAPLNPIFAANAISTKNYTIEEFFELLLNNLLKPDSTECREFCEKLIAEAKAQSHSEFKALLVSAYKLIQLHPHAIALSRWFTQAGFLTSTSVKTAEVVLETSPRSRSTNVTADTTPTAYEPTKGSPEHKLKQEADAGHCLDMFNFAKVCEKVRYLEQALKYYKGAYDHKSVHDKYLENVQYKSPKDISIKVLSLNKMVEIAIATRNFKFIESLDLFSINKKIITQNLPGLFNSKEIDYKEDAIKYLSEKLQESEIIASCLENNFISYLFGQKADLVRTSILNWYQRTPQDTIQFFSKVEQREMLFLALPEQTLEHVRRLLGNPAFAPLMLQDQELYKWCKQKLSDETVRAVKMLGADVVLNSTSFVEELNTNDLLTTILVTPENARAAFHRTHILAKFIGNSSDLLRLGRRAGFGSSLESDSENIAFAKVAKFLLETPFFKETLNKSPQLKESLEKFVKEHAPAPKPEPVPISAPVSLPPPINLSQQRGLTAAANVAEEKDASKELPSTGSAATETRQPPPAPVPSIAKKSAAAAVSNLPAVQLDATDRTIKDVPAYALKALKAAVKEEDGWSKEQGARDVLLELLQAKNKKEFDEKFEPFKTFFKSDEKTAESIKSAIDSILKKKDVLPEFEDPKAKKSSGAPQAAFSLNALNDARANMHSKKQQPQITLSVDEEIITSLMSKITDNVIQDKLRRKLSEFLSATFPMDEGLFNTTFGDILKTIAAITLGSSKEDLAILQAFMKARGVVDAARANPSADRSSSPSKITALLSSSPRHKPAATVNSQPQPPLPEHIEREEPPVGEKKVRPPTPPKRMDLGDSKLTLPTDAPQKEGEEPGDRPPPPVPMRPNVLNNNSSSARGTVVTAQVLTGSAGEKADDDKPVPTGDRAASPPPTSVLKPPPVKKPAAVSTTVLKPAAAGDSSAQLLRAIRERGGQATGKSKGISSKLRDKIKDIFRFDNDGFAKSAKVITFIEEKLLLMTPKASVKQPAPEVDPRVKLLNRRQAIEEGRKEEEENKDYESPENLIDDPYDEEDIQRSKKIIREIKEREAKEIAAGSGRINEYAYEANLRRITAILAGQNIYVLPDKIQNSKEEKIAEIIDLIRKEIPLEKVASIASSIPTLKLTATM